MNRESVIAQFPTLLPLAIDWAKSQGQRIRETGLPLIQQEIEDAKAAGVTHPEHVRLLQVDAVPRPDNSALRAACDAINFLTPATRGLTLGYGVFIRQDCWRDRALVAHELVHVAQYERLGGIDNFLRQYLMECLTVGYDDSPLEREAVSVTNRVVR